MHAVAARARTQHLCSKAGAPGTLVGAQPPPPPAHLQRAVSAPRTDLVRHARYRVDAGLRRGGRAAGPWLAKSTEVRTRNALLRVPWLCVSVLRAFVLGVCLCSIRLDRAHFARQRRRHRGDSAEFARQRCPHRGGSPARALCWRCACLCALAHPMLALRVPAARALAAHACACALALPMLALHAHAVRARAVRARAVRFRAGRVECLCSARLHRAALVDVADTTSKDDQIVNLEHPVLFMDTNRRASPKVDRHNEQLLCTH